MESRRPYLPQTFKYGPILVPADVVGLLLLQQEDLDLNDPSMSDKRRHFIESVGKYGDLRAQIASVLSERWQNVSVEARTGDVLIEMMVKPLLGLVSSSSEQVSEMAKGMFFELLQAEFKATSDFKRVGRDAVDAIDDIMKREIARDAAGSGGDAASDNALLILFRESAAVISAKTRRS